MINGMNTTNGSSVKKKIHDRLSKRKTLRVWSKKAEFLARLNDNQLVIFVGEPGAGKSTQVPQFVLEVMDLKNQMVCCTQPNRFVAFYASIRAAEELDVSLGGEVGFHIYFEERISSKTILK